MSRYLVKNTEKNAQKNRAKNFFEAFCTVWVKKLLNQLHIELIDSLMKRNVVVFEAENGLDALRNLEFEVCVSLAAFDGNADLSVTRYRCDRLHSLIRR